MRLKNINNCWIVLVCRPGVLHSGTRLSASLEEYAYTCHHLNYSFYPQQISKLVQICEWVVCRMYTTYKWRSKMMMLDSKQNSVKCM